jgi:phosphohistidine phosphatase
VLRLFSRVEVARPREVVVKTLHLLRHAKSDWSSATRPDHDRPLNERGKRARTDVAAHVKGWRVDLVVCSTARRARATAEPVVETLGCPVHFEPELYAADEPDDVIAVIKALPEEADAVMLIGHNPWTEELTAALCGTSPPYPTAALGSIELDIDQWSQLGPGSGMLVAHVTPSRLRAL